MENYFDVLNDLKVEDLNVQKTERTGGSEYFYKPDWKNKMNNGEYLAKGRFLPNPFDMTTPIIKRVRYYIKDEDFGINGFFHSVRSMDDNSCKIYKTYYQVLNKAKEDNNAALKKYIEKSINYNCDYTSYFYVIEDFNEPSYNDKLLLFTYKKTVHDLILEAMKGKPQIGRKPINVFDPINSKDFILDLKMIKVNGIDMPNWDGCHFADEIKPIEVAGIPLDTSDEKMKKAYLDRFVNKENIPNIDIAKYKEPNEEDKAKLDAYLKNVLLRANGGKTSISVNKSFDAQENNTKITEREVSSAPKVQKVSASAGTESNGELESFLGNMK